jgi:hypothetical protein
MQEEYKKKSARVPVLFLAILTMIPCLEGQKGFVSNEDIGQLVRGLKNDARGPYKDIRWFCPDGRVNPPKDTCGQEGAYQRARYKDEIVQLAGSNHIYLGQILMGTDFNEFWDGTNYHDRFKQYQLEQYLKLIDDGWINKKAQYYRGAIQAEDEMGWGRDFLKFLLEDERNIRDRFFLLRQAIKTIPHAEDHRTRQQVRILAQQISERDSRFSNMRIKIHGNPGKDDIASVRHFFESNQPFRDTVQGHLEVLMKLLEDLYKPVDIDEKVRSIVKLPRGLSLTPFIRGAFMRLKDEGLSYEDLVATAEALSMIRLSLEEIPRPEDRLRMMDLSIALEEIILQRISALTMAQLGDLNGKICALGEMAHGTGLIETWEWNYMEGQLSSCQFERFELFEVLSFQEDAKSLVEWGANTVRAHYNPVVEKYAGFEPLASQLIDDLVRSSILLPLGQSVDRLAGWVSRQIPEGQNKIDRYSSVSFRGLNPGYAKGTLEVIKGNPDELIFKKDHIYVFDHPPSDLKPVAGILSVSGGNPVSHVQLLARNLGIPNAVLNLADFQYLEKMNGQEVFFAVGIKGNIVFKSARLMNEVEKALFIKNSSPGGKVSVPTSQLVMTDSIIDLKDLDKSASGITCGPKAANLAELKRLYPASVVDGLVIPFGIFKKHMDQAIPGSDQSYWQYLEESFQNATSMQNEMAAETYLIERLTSLREALLDIEFIPEFERDFRRKFEEILGSRMGTIPVFLRSDTNMEDLKEFTGAGLNLTLFNILEEDKILRGIKEVWASPYTERSFKWRQKFLLNPENVYPSILIIPGVNVDCSGVLITKGVKDGDPRKLTIAFSRGVGGAVDGQAAESYTLHYNGFNHLNTPAREIRYRHLPKSGGTATSYTYFSKPILSEEQLLQIREFAYDISRKIQFFQGQNERIAHDVELGFTGEKLWLFQVRPFVENKHAKTSDYLSSISPPDPKNTFINFDSPL